MVNDPLRLAERMASTTGYILTILGLILHRTPSIDAPLNAKNLMDRRELLLAVLASAKGQPFSPAQIQKAIFLVDTNLPHLVHRGSHYQFVPYNYGPFDRDVYVEAENLQREGSAIISSPNGRWSTYAASDRGVKLGNEILGRLKQESRRYIDSVVEWVLVQSFGSLVKSIYDAYPEMKQNSIFQG